MSGSVTAYIALGANLGDAAATLERAMDAIGGLPKTRVMGRSSLYRTAPVESSGRDYVNAVAGVETALAPEELLRALQALERGAGRERPWRNAPRTLDLDILLYGDLDFSSQTLTIPHPRMNQRAFVLVPLHEIAPGKVLPAQLEAVAGQAIERIGQR